MSVCHCLYACLFICLSVFVYVCLPMSVYACLSISVCLSMSICLSISVFYFCLCLFIHPSVRPLSIRRFAPLAHSPAHALTAHLGARASPPTRCLFTNSPARSPYRPHHSPLPLLLTHLFAHLPNRLSVRSVAGVCLKWFI